MNERYLSKTPNVTFIYLSKCNIKLPSIFANSKKRFLWTGLLVSNYLPWEYLQFPAVALWIGNGPKREAIMQMMKNHADPPFGTSYSPKVLKNRVSFNIDCSQDHECRLFSEKVSFVDKYLPVVCPAGYSLSFFWTIRWYKDIDNEKIRPAPRRCCPRNTLEENMQAASSINNLF